MADTKPHRQAAAVLAQALLLSLGLLAWIIFLAGTAAQQHKGDSIFTEILDVTAMQWLLVALFPVLLIAQALVSMIPRLWGMRLPIGILLGVLLAWFGYALDTLTSIDRKLNNYGGSFGRSTRAAEAGGILCSLVLVGAILSSTMERPAAAAPPTATHNPGPQPAYTAHHAAAPQYAGNAPAMHVAPPLANAPPHADYHLQHPPSAV